MRKLVLVWTCGLWFLGISTLMAQELRIYTVTKDLSQSSGEQPSRTPVIARSLTLFHAGKVYDYIDSLREVTIFETAHRRFTILNEAAATYTVVTQDEVRRFLSLAEDRARELAGNLVRENDPEQRFAVELLQFQLRPEVETSFEPASRQLKVTAPYFSYDVACAQSPQPAAVDSYLRYADAVAELNSVLHPHSLLPGPRLELNRQLRERHLLPVRVRRTMEFGQVSDLVAEHEWKWALTELDRQMIDSWESQMAKGQVRKLSFEQMQRAVLTGKLSKR